MRSFLLLQQFENKRRYDPPDVSFRRPDSFGRDGWTTEKRPGQRDQEFLLVRKTDLKFLKNSRLFGL
jgi:hypothetical protein